MAVSNTAKIQPEIDGLRAIAVLGVIFYHLNWESFRGGFVGVDIFFVISGYLITGLIRRQSSADCFSYREFFLRRVRRIIPALFFVTTLVGVAAVVLLLPRELFSFAWSVIAQPLAVQNLHFLVEGEYFNGAEGKPLLHTWSLGVEEQFYLVWPLLVVMISRLPRGFALLLLGSVLALSFCVNLYLVNISPKASFFLLPSRAWELCAGGILAIAHESSRFQGFLSLRQRAVLGAASLLIILVSFRAISSGIPFPGWVAGVPTIATVMLVWAFSSEESLVSRLLSVSVLSFIGRLSYSLYLWHWPVIVFAKHFGFDPRNIGVAVIVVSIAICLSLFSYQIIEQPIRKRNFLRTDGALIGGVVASGLLLVTLSLVVIGTKGMAFRYSEPARSMLTASFDSNVGTNRCGFLFRMTQHTASICQINGVGLSNEVGGAGGVLLWGNSHASMWGDLLAEMGDEFGVSVYLNAHNCRPTADHNFCNSDVQESVLSKIKAVGVSDVILANTWYGAYGVSDQEFENELSMLVERLTRIGVRIWLVLDIPESEMFNPEGRYKLDPQEPTFGTIGLGEFESGDRSREIKLFSSLAAKDPRIRILDPSSAFCFDGHRCYGGAGSEAWYRDTNHVTYTGSLKAYSVFLPVFSSVRPGF